MHLILVHIGPDFPPYINDCILQISKITSIPIHVLLPKNLIQHLQHTVYVHPIEDLSSPYIDHFESQSILDLNFRNGFWKYTTMRFFYIHAYASKHNLEDVFHIEYDNLIYYDFTKHINTFRQKDAWIVLDSENRCIPSFMYFRNHSSIQRILPHLIQSSKNGMNDMTSLASYYRFQGGRVGLLPIINDYKEPIPFQYYEHASEFQCIFDGACVGQYIGGVDPRNTPGDTTGFINETSIFRCDNCTIEWRTIDSLKRPFLNNIPLVNLHIHSKDLKRWSS